MESIEAKGINFHLRRYLFFNHRLLNFTINYPRYSLDFYRQQVASVGPKSTKATSKQLEKEKRVWLYFTAHDGSLKYSSIVRAYWTVYVIRFLVYLLFMVAIVDFARPQRNIHLANNETQFGCLKTNCKQISNTRTLPEDLIRLPLLDICQPQLKWLLNPMIDTHLLGLMLIAMIGFSIFSLVVLLSLVNERILPPNPTLMFILCPNVSVQMARRQTLQWWRRLNDSYRNFEQTQMSPQKAYLGPSGFFSDRPVCDSKLRLALPEQVDERKVLNSIPINRTSWWYEKILASFGCSMGAVKLGTYAILFSFFAYLNFGQLDRYRQAWLDYARYVDSHANCSIRYLKSNNPIRLDHIEHHWNLWSSSEFLLATASAVLSLTGGVVCLYQATSDIRVIISELKIQLRVANELAELRRHKGAHRHASNHRRESSSSSLLVESIRQKVYLQTEYSVVSLLVDRRFNRSQRPLVEGKVASLCENLLITELESQLACQEFAANLLARHGYNEPMFVELLESIQVNYWHLSDLVHEYNGPVELQLWFAYLTNFSFCLMSLYFYRKSIESLPLFINLVAISSINTFILLSSIVHSEARKLEPLFWSLLVRTRDHQNTRIRHLNHLFKKQLAEIDSNGGISLRAFGTNITYVRILQNMLWTTSIMLFAYTRR